MQYQSQLQAKSIERNCQSFSRTLQTRINWLLSHVRKTTHQLDSSSLLHPQSIPYSLLQLPYPSLSSSSRPPSLDRSPPHRGLEWSGSLSLNHLLYLHLKKESTTSYQKKVRPYDYSMKQKCSCLKLERNLIFRKKDWSRINNFPAMILSN